MKKETFYEIAIGERRWRACRRLGYSSIPALVRKLTDEQMLEMALVENLQRKNLNPIEEASGYSKLQQKFGWTQEEVAKKVGKTRDYIAQRLRLLDFPPDIRELVSRDTITPTHAELIASLKDPRLVERALRTVVDKNLSTHQLEPLVKGLLQEKEFSDFIPSLLEFYMQRAKAQRTCAHAADDCCMLFAWKVEPANWIDRLAGKVEFTRKDDKWHPKISPYLCGLCTRYFDNRIFKEYALHLLLSLFRDEGVYRCLTCNAVDSSGLCLLWAYNCFPSSVEHYLKLVPDSESQRKNIVKEKGGKFHINVKTFPFACALCSNFFPKAE